MRRQLLRKLLLGFGILLLCGASVALAQYSRVPRPTNDFLSQLQPLEQPSTLTGALIAERALIDVAAAVLGFLIGAFFSPLLRRVRRWVLLLLFLGALAFAWFGPAPFADWAANALSIFCFAAAFGFGIRLQLKSVLAQREAEEAERPTSFGSAKWATEAYLRERGLFDGKGFFLGEFLESGNRNEIHYSGTRHLLTVAPTRSGKGVASIIPNLLTYEGSVFIIDPKGENAMITASRRGDGDTYRRIPGLGQSVFLVDPWNIAASDLGLRPARFNPLDWIKADDPDAAENAFLLADALVPAESDGEARFWDDEAKALLTGVILFVATSPKEAANRHLGRVRDILLLDDEGFKAVLTTMFNEPLPVVTGTAARTAGKDPKLRSNVLAAVQSHTHFLDSPRIRESLSASDFRFEDLRTRPTTIYLILPADRLKTFDRWLRLLIQQAITVNARDISAKPEKPVLFLLDEMASLGRLSMVEQAYGLMAGFGMQLWGIVQDLSQLERIYGDGWQTFISNSGVIQYFGSRDKITAEYFSTLCGVTTIRIFSLSYALGTVFGYSWSTSSGGSTTSGESESRSDTHTIGSNESQRQLAYPDELMVLKEDAEIVFVENYDPIHARKLRWYQNTELRALGVNLHPELEQTPLIEPSRQAAPSAQQATPAPRKNAFEETLQRVGDKARATVSDRINKTAKTPTPPREPLPEPEIAEPHVVGQYEQGGAVFTAYSDNSVEMTTQTFSYRFASMDDLRAYMASQRAPAKDEG